MKPESGTRYTHLSLREFLAELAAPGPAPAAGSAAALVTAEAAALCEKTALLSVRQLGEELAAELADIVRQAAAQAMRLCDADAAAYGAVIRAKRAVRTGSRSPDAIADALIAAADTSLLMIESAVEISSVAARLAGQGNPNLRGDAISAGLLAHAAACAAGVLVRINLAEVSPARASGDTARAAMLLSRVSANLDRMYPL
jgi:formiminotetrahydrofolate cyclodeaminase